MTIVWILSYLCMYLLGGITVLVALVFLAKMDNKRIDRLSRKLRENCENTTTPSRYLLPEL